MQATHNDEVVQAGLSAGPRQALALSIVRWEAATGVKIGLPPVHVLGLTPARDVVLQVGHGLSKTLSCEVICMVEAVRVLVDKIRTVDYSQSWSQCLDTEFWILLFLVP